MVLLSNSEAFVPKNDYVFKRLFGHVGNEEITKGLLNSILETKVEEINLEGNTILERDLIDDKLGVLDIKAVLNNAVTCDIEMQVAEQDNIEERLMYYWSKMFIGNIHKGDNYGTLRKCIAIMFIDFNLENLAQIPKSHTEWEIREKDFSKIVLTEVLELHIISLPKLMELAEKNKLPEGEKKLKSWVKFLLDPQELGVMEMEGNDALKKAKEEFDTLSQDEYEQRLAELRQKEIMDRKARESFARRKGLEEGIKQGLEQGEKQEKQKIAKEMLKNNVDMEIIKKCTGLSAEEIEKLK